MTSIWSFLQQTAAAAVAAALLLLLRQIFRDKLSPRCQSILWGVLLLRLLVPARLTGPAADLRYLIDYWRTAAELRLSSAYSSPWTGDLPLLPVPLPPAVAPRSVTDWLFLLYLAGVLFFLLRALKRALELRALLSQAEALTDTSPIRALAEAHRLPMPRRVVTLPGLKAPFLAGVVRPTLVLPAGEETASPVLLHELFHLRQRDVVWGWLDTLLCCIHWPDPLVWYALDQAANDRERRCDQLVLERLEGEARRDYGYLLLSMAGSKPRPGTTTMANGARHIKERVEAIARSRRFPKGMELAAACMAVVLGLSLVVPVRAVLREEDRPASTAQALTLARRTRPTTPVGALDTYAKALYTERRDPETALFYHMMALPEADRRNFALRYGGLEAAWEDRQPPSGGVPYEAGPYIVGLVPEGEGWLCQVFFFQDFWDVEDPQVGYLCHTVSLQPEGRYWTVRELSIQTGAVSPEGEDWIAQYNDLAGLVTDETVLPAAAAWTGEAAGIQVRLEPVNRLRLAGAPYGGEQNWLHMLFAGIRPAESLPQLDDPYTAGVLIWRATVTDRTGKDREISLRVYVLDAEGQRAASGEQFQTSFRFESPQAAGELFCQEQTLFNRGGGGTGGNGGLAEMRYIFGQYGYEGELTVDGTVYPLTLEREVSP